MWLTDLSKDLQKELKQIYGSLSEILRHFWATIPPSTPQLLEKANRMIDALQRFDQVTITNQFNIQVFNTEFKQFFLMKIKNQTG